MKRALLLLVIITAASAQAEEINWSTCAGDKNTEKCRLNLISLVKENDCAKRWNLFKQTGVECQKTLIIDEKLCPEGCSYGTEAVKLAECFLKQKNLQKANEVQSFISKSLDKDLCFESGGESERVIDTVNDRIEKLKTK